MGLQIIPVEGYGDDTVAGVHNRRLNSVVVPVMQSFEQAQPGVVAAPDWGGSTERDSLPEVVFELDSIRDEARGVPFVSSDPGINRRKAEEFPQEIFMDVDDILAMGELTAN